MPLLNIDELMDDPDFVETNLIRLKANVTLDSHGNSVSAETSDTFTGIVSPESINELDRTPDGDGTMVTGRISVITAFKDISSGSVLLGQQADTIVYGGERFIVIARDDYSTWGNGFIKVMCERQGIKRL